MRETVKSLRMYFLLVGAFSGGSNILTLTKNPTTVGIVFAVAGIAVAGCFIYLGLRLEQLMAAAPTRILQVLLGVGVYMAILAAAGLVFGSFRVAIQGAIWILIVWYLRTNVRRIAAETAAVPMRTEAPSEQ